VDVGPSWWFLAPADRDQLANPTPPALNSMWGTPISAGWIISRGPVANVRGIFPHQPNVCRATALKLCSGYLRP
jgi:hypothetical protein